jgi:hypothetical protein
MLSSRLTSYFIFKRFILGPSEVVLGMRKLLQSGFELVLACDIDKFRDQERLPTLYHACKFWERRRINNFRRKFICKEFAAMMITSKL